jgi:DNA-directed RNA polymerase specialized sigma24 family protein
VEDGCVPDTPIREATGERFAETAWSAVLAAGANTPARAREGMAELCRVYWRPIYAYLRRSGYDVHDAQDFTQSFFQHLLENETLRRVSREKGRFRSFLIGVLKRCLSHDQMQRNTLKRGGGTQFISTDELHSEELHHLRLRYEAAPDEILDARWAGVILDRALENVRYDCAAEGKTDVFEMLSPFLGGNKSHLSYQEVADRMSVGLSAVKTHIHRLRQQFADAVRREVMQTVSAPHEVDEELRELRRVFARVAEQHAL